MNRILTLLILSAGLSYGQTSLINNSYLSETGIQFSISLIQQNYTLSQPLTVKAILRNAGTEERTVTVYPEPSLCFNFNIIDPDRNLAPKDGAYKNPALTGWKDGLKSGREIRLYPGEEFSLNIDLDNWYIITNIGRYSIQGTFMDASQGRKVWSNPVYANIKPNERVAARLKLEDDLRQQEERTNMTPEGTTRYMLQALKDKDWETFFQYWNFEKILNLYKEFGPRYQAATEMETRLAIIEDFKKWYKSQPVYSSLQSFKIQNIVYPPDSRTRKIYCYVDYADKYFPSRYLYTYSFQQKGNKWYLYNIDAFIAKKNAKRQDSEDFDYTETKLTKD